MTVSNNKTILIIEDEKDILFPLKEFLESEDYKVLIAENGFEAMELLKKSAMPNLILLDMKMPVMDGWEFAKEFREKYGQQSPIAVITAAVDAEQRAKDIYANGWIEKPFNLDVLLEKVKRYER